MRTVGIAGTAKNTGKTTSLTAMLEEAVRQKIRIGMTSIGYDGEAFDHLTGLPKPRVHVSEGMLVATAAGTLRGASAGVERVGATGVLTTLGEVVVVRVTRPGLIPLAGPPTGAGVQAVIPVLEQLGAQLSFVDGAFGRMAPFAVLDAVILATGGARSRDIRRLSAETAALAWLFGLPVVSGAVPHTVANMLSEKRSLETLHELPHCTGLRIEGAISTVALEALTSWDGWQSGATCVFTDPIQLALSGDPIRAQDALTLLSQRVKVGTVKPVTMAAVTINPFYPDGGNGRQFQAGYLDAVALREAMKAAVQVPVIDVNAEGATRLLNLLS